MSSVWFGSLSIAALLSTYNSVPEKGFIVDFVNASSSGSFAAESRMPSPLPSNSVTVSPSLNVR